MQTCAAGQLFCALVIALDLVACPRVSRETDNHYLFTANLLVGSAIKVFVIRSRAVII